MTEQPGYTADLILRDLSLPRRIGYAVAGLAGLTGAVMIGVLWATEPVALPGRTQLAFAALIAIGVTWAAFAAWALARRPLFAADRLIAATLAVLFSALTTVGAVAVAVSRSSTSGALAAAGVGLALTAIAVTLLVRACAYRASLVARQRRLQEPLMSDMPEGATVPTRDPLPIGPLALAMRHRRARTGGRRVVVVAVILGLALMAGVALLLISR